MILYNSKQQTLQLITEVRAKEGGGLSKKKQRKKKARSAKIKTSPLTENNKNYLRRLGYKVL